MKTASVNYSMYFGARPDIFRKAEELRKRETQAEKLLWSQLNKSQILGLLFRRQHPINLFIADFYSHKIKLVIEVDGSIHEMSENRMYDIGRSEILDKFGIKVFRFENNEIINNINYVNQTIAKIAQELLSEAPKSPVSGDLGGNKASLL